MFDLEREILAWRRQMIADGLKVSERLDELEDHLRNDIEDQLRGGVGVREAFESAVQRVGEASALKIEFEKVRPAKQNRLLWLALGAKAAIWLTSVTVFLTALHFAFGIGTALKTGTAWFIVLTTVASASSIWWYRQSRLATAHPMGVFTPSPNVQQLLDKAQLEAQRLGHDYVGTEHLLLALLRFDCGAIGTALAKAGVARETLRAAIEARITANIAQGFGPSFPYTPPVNKALRLAVSEAACNRKELDAGHILLGLLRERTGIAGRVLKRLGFKVGRVRSSLTAN